MTAEEQAGGPVERPAAEPAKLPGIDTPAGALMRPPPTVGSAAAVSGYLPRHRGRCLPQQSGDDGKRLPAMQAEGDLLPVGKRQPPRPWRLSVLAHRLPRSVAHDQRNALMRAAHLRTDLPERQAPWPSAATPAHVLTANGQMPARHRECLAPGAPAKGHRSGRPKRPLHRPQAPQVPGTVRGREARWTS
jgi:hypothetical protein